MSRDLGVSLMYCFTITEVETTRNPKNWYKKAWDALGLPFQETESHWDFIEKSSRACGLSWSMVGQEYNSCVAVGVEHELDDYSFDPSALISIDPDLLTRVEKFAKVCGGGTVSWRAIPHYG